VSAQRISVVIPAYNEARTVAEVVRRVLRQPYNSEIVVVDDGSTDDTPAILSELAGPRVRVLRHERNRGKGAALRTGFAAVDGDFVVVQDADLEYDPRDYAGLLEPLIAGDADVVYGSRFTGTPRRVLLFSHTVGNRALTLLSNLATNLNLTDMTTGYKAFRLDVVRRLAIVSDGFSAEPEITAKVARLGCRVYEVPISYRGRTYAEGKKIGWVDGVKMAAAVVRFAMAPGTVSSHAGYDTLSTMDSMANYNRWLWRQIRPHVGQRVFEAGCGTGTISRNLVDREHVVLCDLDDHYLALMRGRYGDRPNVRVHRADLGLWPWPVGSADRFDTVLCMNVLEHLRDDETVLRRFADLLSPGGSVVLLVPAGPALYGTIDRALGHYRRYRAADLKDLFARTGLDVERIAYLNPTGVLGWFVNGRLLRRRAVPPGQARLYDWLYPLIGQLQRLGLPFGLSVLAIGRKSAP
jgi:glycosyltransferase involved in cell wall biosynthesis